MTAYPNITSYNQLLAEGTLGSVNVDFFNSQGQAVSNSVALQTLTYYDQDYGTTINTYGAMSNYYEHNRRLDGAYGNAWYGDCNWLNPVNHAPIAENHFYYLEDFTNGGRYSHLFIEGLTFFTTQRPNLYPTWYNSTFRQGGYYRVDILGQEYPYSHGGVKADIIIQQFGTGLNPFASDKLYLSYAQSTERGAYHSEYRIRVPIGVMLFNDKLYEPTAYQPPVVPPPDSDPPVDQPPIIDEPPTVDPLIVNQEYGNFGGDTTDTGPTPGSDEYGPIDAYNAEPRDVRYYRPELHWWQRWFTWY